MYIRNRTSALWDSARRLLPIVQATGVILASQRANLASERWVTDRAAPVTRCCSAPSSRSLGGGESILVSAEIRFRSFIISGRLVHLGVFLKDLKSTTWGWGAVSSCYVCVLCVVPKRLGGQKALIISERTRPQWSTARNAKLRAGEKNFFPTKSPVICLGFDFRRRFVRCCYLKRHKAAEQETRQQQYTSTPDHSRILSSLWEAARAYAQAWDPCRRHSRWNQRPALSISRFQQWRPHHHHDHTSAGSLS